MADWLHGVGLGGPEQPGRRVWQWKAIQFMAARKQKDQGVAGVGDKICPRDLQ